MLPLCGFTIKFEPSVDYLKLAFAISLLTWIAICLSISPVWLKCILCLGVFALLMQIKQNPMPMPSYTALSYHSTGWLLYKKIGKPAHYKQVDICFDCGFFVLLMLTSEKQKANIVLFSDQITAHQYRTLKMIGKGSQLSR